MTGACFTPLHGSVQEGVVIRLRHFGEKLLEKIEESKERNRGRL